MLCQLPLREVNENDQNLKEKFKGLKLNYNLKNNSEDYLIQKYNILVQLETTICFVAYTIMVYYYL